MQIGYNQCKSVPIVKNREKLGKFEKNREKMTPRLERIGQPSLPKGVITPNVKRCEYCKGMVDRFEHMFICRECGAYGDLMTGIMNNIQKKMPKTPMSLFLERNPHLNPHNQNLKRIAKVQGMKAMEYLYFIMRQEKDEQEAEALAREIEQGFVNNDDELGKTVKSLLNRYSEALK